MDRIMTDEERERIRRQLEAFCTAGPNEVVERAEPTYWGYNTLRPTSGDFDTHDTPEPVQIPEWQHTPGVFSAPTASPAPEETLGLNSEVFSAQSNGDQQSRTAKQEENSAQARSGAGAATWVSAGTADAIRPKGTEERGGSRWFGIRGILGDTSAPSNVPAVPDASHVPVLAVFSIDGGVGKTSLAATLSRKLSAQGERVLLMETTPYGLLPFFFGARDRRPSALRTFRPPAPSTDAPLQLISAEPEVLLPGIPEQAQFPAEIAAYVQGASRVIIDIPTGAVATVRQILHMSPVILVPMVPDMKSVLGAGSIESLLRPVDEAADKPAEIYYVVNQFESSLPLHLDVREALRKRLGDRLLPFAMRREPAISEALAEGMTLLDYAADSSAVEDFSRLGEWLASVSAPASAAMRGTRWNEA